MERLEIQCGRNISQEFGKEGCKYRWFFNLTTRVDTIFDSHADNILPQILDEAVLPNYPYRDDGILVYNVIKDYVTNVINIYYGTCCKIACLLVYISNLPFNITFFC